MKILVITVIIVASIAIIALISLLTIPDNRQHCTFCPEMPSPNQTPQTTNVKTNPFGIVGLMYYYGSGPCGIGTCPLNTFNLKMNSNQTAYLLGYNICDGNSCIVRNGLSILLPLNVIGTPNYKFIALPENSQWKYDDVFHIQIEVSSTSDNKTAIWTDLGHSTIIH